jgi:VCBS repeat-containing protein
VELGTLTAILVAGPASGTLTLNANGSYTYTPNANFNGTDSFTYRVSDGTLDSNVATVSISVTAVNDPPVAGNDTALVALNTSTRIDVRANDSDVDGPSLTTTVLMGPAHGTVAVNADGSLQYNPTTGYTGSDTITYRLGDGSDNSNTATVAITVATNIAPTATHSAVTGLEDTPYVFTWADFHVTDPDSTDLSIRIHSLPDKGKLQIYNGTTWNDASAATYVSKADIDAGRLRYAPPQNASGYDLYPTDGTGNQRKDYSVWVFRAYDGLLHSSSRNMTVDIAPVADTPLLNIVNTGSTLREMVFISGLDGAPNPDTGSTPLSQSTYDGWTLITTGDQNPGGTNVFEIWHGEDMVQNQAGQPVEMTGNWWNDQGWLELNDAAGSASQTLGIERTVDTVAGATYALEFHYAPRPGHALGECAVGVYIDGVLVDTVDFASGQEEFTWHGVEQQFLGTGAPMTIRLVLQSSTFSAEGHGAFIDNFELKEYTPNTGGINSDIYLQPMWGGEIDGDDSETFQLTIGGIPVGATVSDGNHSFTATAGNQMANVTGWSGWETYITPPTDYYGVFDLTVTATASETYSTSTASVSRTITVRVLAAPVATGQTITVTEGTPYYFQWADFGVSDLDTAAPGVFFDDHPSNGYMEMYNGASWEYFSYGEVSRAVIEAGYLRFWSRDNESGPGGEMIYSVTDGQQSSAPATMTIDVTPVADAPVLNVWGAGAGEGAELFCIEFESVLDEGAGPTIVNDSTLEGWTLVTAGDRAAGGTNAFEVWSDGDQATDVNGVPTTLYPSDSHPEGRSWISLADASGSGIQTLGIERSLNTIAGAVYTLTMDMAGEPYFGTGYTGVRVLIDDQELDIKYPHCETEDLCWEQYGFQFTGTGSPMTIRILAHADEFAPDGRGVMLDNIAIEEQIPNTGYQNNPIGLQDVISWLVDDDGSETLSLSISGIPVGATLTDGEFSFTATAGNTTVNIDGWQGYDLDITPPTDFFGAFDLTVTATATEAAGGSASTVKILTVHVLAAPLAAPQAVATAEDTPYIFQWADFGASDADSTNPSIYIEGGPANGSIGYFNGTVSDDWFSGEVSRADIEAGYLRFTPNENESGVAGVMTYYVFDGQQYSALAEMAIDVTSAVDAPVVYLWGAGGGTETELFCIGFESVLDGGAGPTVVNSSTLEGWTLISAAEGVPGGTNAFMVWSEGDQITNEEGDPVTMLPSESHPGDHNWISLADTGSGTQSLGIERNVTTIAHAVYTLSLDLTGVPGFQYGYAGVRVEVNGEELDVRYPQNDNEGLDWYRCEFQFEGTGSAMTIRLSAVAGNSEDGIHGVMVDNISLNEQIPNEGPKNSGIYLQGIHTYLTDDDGSETLQTVLDEIPVGATLSDGVNNFTATTGNRSVNLAGWDVFGVRITPPLDFIGSFVMTARAISTDTATSQTATTTRGVHVHVLDQTSPLVLDLNGDGIRTVALADTHGTFDLMNTGIPVRSGWISSGDAFLAVDNNRNGRIDSRDELFGGDLGEGFAKLSTYDTNGDGVVNKKDARFKDLRVWQDKNGNHRTDKGELETLKKAGVKSLNTGYTVREESQNGNQIIERGTATRSNGKSIEMSDVYFPTAPAEGAVGASFGPGWQEPRDRSARIIVESALRQRVTSGDLMERMLNSFATPSVKSPQHVHSSPKPDPSGGKQGGGLLGSSPKPDPRKLPQEPPTIDWRAKQHTDAIPIDYTADVPREAEWLGEVLGVKRAKNPDLGKLTGLRIRLPLR